MRSLQLLTVLRSLPVASRCQLSVSVSVSVHVCVRGQLFLSPFTGFFLCQVEDLAVLPLLSAERWLVHSISCPVIASPALCVASPQVNSDIFPFLLPPFSLAKVTLGHFLSSFRQLFWALLEESSLYGLQFSSILGTLSPFYHFSRVSSLWPWGCHWQFRCVPGR